MNFLPPSGFYQEITRGTTMSSPSSSSTLHQILNPHAEEQTLQLGHGSSSEKEHMFDKVVTPSDVGKLNRLVIPKQHAEKYFPLDASTNEKGLLLNFEDSNGKPWRFRYSYWNSSQSYVMTKGWSRFVKEKNLEAGDIVSFSRGVAQPDRLFIDWRRRPDAFPMLHSIPTHHYHPFYLQQRPREYSQYIPYPNVKYAPNYGTIVNGNPCVPGSVIYMRSNNSNSRIAPRQMVYESVPVVEGKVAAKRLRLFGVNMDCPVDSGSDIEYCDNAPMLPFHLLTGPDITTSSSNSSSLIHNSVAYGRNAEKGKGSMSLDLDI